MSKKLFGLGIYLLLIGFVAELGIIHRLIDPILTEMGWTPFDRCLLIVGTFFTPVIAGVLLLLLVVREL